MTRKDHVNVWEAHGRNLSVVYGLNNLAAGPKSLLHEIAWRRGPAHVERGPGRHPGPVSAGRARGPQILEDAEWPKTTYHVFLGVDIFAPEIPVEPASADYRLVDSAGRHYRIMQYQRAERIDALPLAVCVLIIEGSEGGAIDRLSSSSSGN